MDDNRWQKGFVHGRLPIEGKVEGLEELGEMMSMKQRRTEICRRELARQKAMEARMREKAPAAVKLAKIDR
jgi:hypothetical protein